MIEAARRRAIRLLSRRRVRAVLRRVPFGEHDLGVLVRALPALALRQENRSLFAEMRRFTRDLPKQLDKPLPDMMGDLTGPDGLPRPDSQTEDAIRHLADLTVLLDRGSSLGVCLRRSLTRYYYLRRAGLEVDIHFGARFTNGRPDREFTGHAWLTLDGQPYYEASENWRGFSIMFSFPQNARRERPVSRPGNG